MIRLRITGRPFIHIASALLMLHTAVSGNAANTDDFFTATNEPTTFDKTVTIGGKEMTVSTMFEGSVSNSYINDYGHIMWRDGERLYILSLAESYKTATSFRIIELDANTGALVSCSTREFPGELQPVTKAYEGSNGNNERVVRTFFMVDEDNQPFCVNEVFDRTPDSYKTQITATIYKYSVENDVFTETTYRTTKILAFPENQTLMNDFMPPFGVKGSFKDNNLSFSQIYFRASTSKPVDRLLHFEQRNTGKAYFNVRDVTFEKRNTVTNRVNSTVAEVLADGSICMTLSRINSQTNNFEVNQMKLGNASESGGNLDDDGLFASYKYTEYQDLDKNFWNESVNIAGTKCLLNSPIASGFPMSLYTVGDDNAEKVLIKFPEATYSISGSFGDQTPLACAYRQLMISEPYYETSTQAARRAEGEGSEGEGSDEPATVTEPDGTYIYVYSPGVFLGKYLFKTKKDNPNTALESLCVDGSDIQYHSGRLTRSGAPATLRIYDLSGRLMMSVDECTEADLGALGRGCFIARWGSASSKIMTGLN